MAGKRKWIQPITKWNRSAIQCPLFWWHSLRTATITVTDNYGVPVKGYARCTAGQWITTGDHVCTPPCEATEEGGGRPWCGNWRISCISGNLRYCYVFCPSPCQNHCPPEICAECGPNYYYMQEWSCPWLKDLSYLQAFSPKKLREARRIILISGFTEPWHLFPDRFNVKNSSLPYALCTMLYANLCWFLSLFWGSGIIRSRSPYVGVVVRLITGDGNNILKIFT